MPNLITIAIIDFLTIWNEHLSALIFLTAPDGITVSVVIRGYLTEYRTVWSRLCAVGLISSLSILILTLCVKRHIVKSFRFAGKIV